MLRVIRLSDEIIISFLQPSVFVAWVSRKEILAKDLIRRLTVDQNGYSTEKERNK